MRAPVRRVVAVLLLGALTVGGAGACTGNDRPTPGLPTSPDASGRQVPDPLADLPVRALVEPPVKARSARLLDKAGQIFPFCAVRDRIENLKEPAPTDVKKVLPYARLYYSALRAMNQDEAWDNPRRHAAGAPAKLSLSDYEKAALRVEREEVYAYLVRVQSAKDYANADVITRDQLEARLIDAFARLADGPYGAADDLLSDFTQESC